MLGGTACAAESSSALDFALQFPLLAEKFWGQLDKQSVNYLRQTCRKARQAVDELYSCLFDAGSLDLETSRGCMQLYQAGRLCRVAEFLVRCGPRISRTVQWRECQVVLKYMHCFFRGLDPALVQAVCFTTLHHDPLGSLQVAWASTFVLLA